MKFRTEKLCFLLLLLLAAEARQGSSGSWFSTGFLPQPDLAFAADVAEQLKKNSPAKRPDPHATRGRLQTAMKPKRAQAGVPINAVDSIVAVIDGEPITMSDLRASVLKRQEGLGPGARSGAQEETLRRGSEAGRKALEDMIQDKLLAREAESANISATAEEISTYIEEVQKQNNVDQRTFESILASRGIGKEAYREQVRDDIVRSRLVAIKVRNKVNVLEEDIDKFLRSEKSTGTSEGRSSRVHLEQIMLKAPSDDPEEIEVIRNKIENIREDALDGYPLEDLDKENYSDLVGARLSDLRPELENAAKKLKPGDVSPVLCYESVCSILKRIPEGEREEKENPVPRVSEEERSNIRKQLWEQKFQEALEQYLKVELPQKYQVEMKW